MKPRKILVTGGTGTLGSAIVAQLCARNYAVTANYFYDETRAHKLARQTGCALHRADIRDENCVQTLFETHDFGAVIHAAGANHDALLLRTSNEIWREQMRWLDAAWLLTRASLRTSPVNGNLMLISSRVGERGSVGQSAYATSKGAIIGLMHGAARERRDMRINAICPGYALSELSENLSPQIAEKRAQENWLLDAEAAFSLAQMCLYLLKSEISGQVLRPDCRI